MNHYFDAEGAYTHSLPEGGGRIPRNARRAALPVEPWTGVWPRWDRNAKRWELVEDHRVRTGAHAQKGTPYRLPDDAADAPARMMTEVGPLPQGALPIRPDAPTETPEVPENAETTEIPEDAETTETM